MGVRTALTRFSRVTSCIQFGTSSPAGVVVGWRFWRGFAGLRSPTCVFCFIFLRNHFFFFYSYMMRAKSRHFAFVVYVQLQTAIIHVLSYDISCFLPDVLLLLCRQRWWCPKLPRFIMAIWAFFQHLCERDVYVSCVSYIYDFYVLCIYANKPVNTFTW